MADTFLWTTPGSGTFDTASEWTDVTNAESIAFPGSTDTANLVGPSSGTAQTIDGPGDVAVLNVVGLNVLSGSFITGFTTVDDLTGAASLALSGSLSATSGLTVGDVGAGALSVDSGSTVTAGSGSGASQLVIGSQTNASGTVTVAGTLDLAGPSQVTNYGLFVGEDGAGALLVSGAGATVDDENSNGLVVGYSAGSSGSVVVNDGASATFGSTNSDSLAAVGIGRAGDGALTVDGSGSTVTSDGGVYVGRGAAGTLVVSNQAVFNETAAATYFEVGDGSSSSNSHVGGTGSATVESDGTLSAAGDLRIGGYGVNGAVTVSTGGLVSATASTSATAIGLGVSGTVDGVFESGTGSLDIEAGGTVDVAGTASPGVAGISVGSDAGAFGTVDVSGAGAVLNAGNNLIVVGSGGTGVMNVTGGGAIVGTSPGATYGAIVIGNSADGVGTLTVSGDGSTATANGALTVGYQGTGTLVISDNGQVSATNVNVDAVSAIDLSSGTLSASTTVSLDAGAQITGSGVLSGPVSGAGTLTASGGTLTLSQATTGAALNIGSDGDLVLSSGVASGEQVTFANGTGGRLDLLTPGSFLGTLNVVDAANTIFALGATSIDFTGGNVITLLDSGNVDLGTIELGQSFLASQVQDNGGTITIACFAAGTCISTPRGEVAVEALQVGEAVTLADGGAAPIVWLGHRHVDCARHPRPWDVMPVRVHAGAFGPGLPHADLLLSPDHAVFADGHLVPIRYLANGATVVQEQVESVTYWHVELPQHGVVLAEGLPAESYLETGNRGTFANGGPAVHLHPDFALRVWDAISCAPLLLEGPHLVAIRLRLLARAAELGHALTEDPGLRLLVDGRELPAVSVGRHRCVRLPPGAETVRLVSRCWVPACTRAQETDARLLGVAISHLWLDRREVCLESAGLGAGWLAPEAGWRWTNGDAAIAVQGVRELAFELALAGTYWHHESARTARVA